MKIWAGATVTFMFFVFSLNLFNITFASNLEFYAGRNYNNRSLDELAQDFWKWWFTVPQTISKDPNTGLDECLMGVDSKNQTILLLNSYLQEYSTSCNIPAEKSILVPLLVGECDPTVPELRSKEISELWKCAADADETFKFWEVVLDDKVIFKKNPSEEINSNLKEEILVRNSSSFMLNIPLQNHYDAPEGTYPAVVDGYYLHLKPFSPGEHVLTYKIIHEDQNVLDLGNKPRAVTGEARYVFNVK